MEHVAIDELEPEAIGDGSDRRKLSGPLDAAGVAVNYYRIAPGEGFPGGVHAHADQEEVFVVLAGNATFETMDGEVTLGAGEAVRFAPGEFQSGRNDHGTDLVALAIGAPRGSEEVRIPFDCPSCGHGELRVGGEGPEPALVCPDCGTERVPAACPACGSDALRATVPDPGRTAVVCDDCGAEFADPRVRG